MAAAKRPNKAKKAENDNKTSDAQDQIERQGL